MVTALQAVLPPDVGSKYTAAIHEQQRAAIEAMEGAIACVHAGCRNIMFVDDVDPRSIDTTKLGIVKGEPNTFTGDTWPQHTGAGRTTTAPPACRTACLPHCLPADDAGVLLDKEALIHREMYRLRCDTCASNFCKKCKTEPYHLGKTCEQAAAAKVAAKCRCVRLCCSHVHRGCCLAMSPAPSLSSICVVSASVQVL